MLKKIRIEVEKGHFNEYVFDDSKPFPFEKWPIEVQIEFLNIVIILYNLFLIPEDVFRKKYLKKVEDYSEFMDIMDNFSLSKKKGDDDDYENFSFF
ncbi:MAG: hypothetical protein ACTSX0_04005 [Promethearchaeota archaeon]